MNIYMEEDSKKSKGNSARDCCEEIGSEYNVFTAVSTVCKKVRLDEKVSSGELTNNLIQLFKPLIKQQGICGSIQ